jgi:hypothetical protein
MCANGEVAIGCVIVGRRIEALLDERVNDAFGIEIVIAVVVVVVVVAVGVVVGVVVGIVGMVVGIVGMVVGIVVGIVGMVVGILVGIVGDVMTGDGLPIIGDMPIDRRARPSSGSTEIDAFLLDRR